MKKFAHTQEHGFLAALRRELREQKGLRQTELAAYLGQTQSYVSKCENGECRLDLVQLRHICQALGLSLSSFVGEFEKRLLAAGVSNTPYARRRHGKAPTTRKKRSGGA